MSSGIDLLKLFDAEADSILAGQLLEFSTLFGLSDRERDVFKLLMSQTVTTEDMAAKLSLSPNTISNHIKSILRKVGVAGKAELVVLFARHLVRQNAQQRLFSRAPRVIVVDDEPDFCEILQDDFTARGVEVTFATDPTKVMGLIAEVGPDVVIADVRMPQMDGMQLLKLIRQSHPFHPRVILVTGYSEYSKEVTLDVGAADLLSKPIDLDRLFLIVMEQFLAQAPDRGRMYRVTPAIPVSIGKLGTQAVTDIGFGGCFIQAHGPEDKVGTSPLTKVKVGDTLGFELPVGNEGGIFPIQGEVVWVRMQGNADLRAGLGVKFTDISDATQKAISAFVRKHDLKSFIPLGKIAS